MSLRLTQAFIRAASPEGHPPLGSLSELRQHMAGTHGFDAAGIMPLRVLMHVHEKDHEDGPGQWNGSADSSGNPGFIARRRSVITGMWSEFEGGR